MLGFLIAVALGFATPHLEEPLARPLARAMRAKVPLEPGETRLFAFLLAMLLAGLLCALFDTGTPLGVVFGGGLGYFALRLSAALRDAIGAPKR